MTMAYRPTWDDDLTHAYAERIRHNNLAWVETTHIAQLKYYSIECTPVASHLNHDGRHNGITRVVRSDGEVVDLGTRTLREKHSA